MPHPGQSNGIHSSSIQIHTFANGVRVRESFLLPAQRERYQRCNIHEPEEESIFLDILQQLPEGGVYINIGAAIGYYPILSKRVKPSLEVIAVEPLRFFREGISEHLLLNNLAGGAIRVMPEAVSIQTGRSQFAERDYSSRVILPHEVLRRLLLIWRTKSFRRKSSERDGSDALGEDLVETVDTIRLFDLLQKVGRTVEFIQMDVQGLEHEILRDSANVLRDGMVRHWLIGTHGKQIHRQCRQELRRWGYRISHDNPAPEGQPDGILAATLDPKRDADWTQDA